MNSKLNEPAQISDSVSQIYVPFNPFFGFAFGRQSYENRKILRNIFVYIFKSLARLALQTENHSTKVTKKEEKSPPQVFI